MIVSRLANLSPKQALIYAVRRMQAPPHAPQPSHHAVNPKLWERIFWFVACPAIAISLINTILAEKEHMEHLMPERPEFRKMEYLRIRNKKFPWGDGNHTLFHNPYLNALPDGYEEMPEPKSIWDLVTIKHR